MAAYNERPYLRRCIERVLTAPLPEGWDREIVFVDDGSTDGTLELARELERQYPGQIRVFAQGRNQGKGAAIARAIREMRGQLAIIQDADLEYDPADYPILLRPLVEGLADVVYGSRFVPRQMRRVLNFHHELGNRFLTVLSNLCTGLNLTDMETGYKAFRADILRTIPIRSRRFGIEPEITAKIAHRRCIVYEVPINYHGRGYLEGKKINWRDGVAAIWTILKYAVIDDCYETRYGHAILADLVQGRRFHEWMASRLWPHLGDRILEVGAGIGNLSRCLPRRELLVLTDCDADYLRLLADAWRHVEGVRVGPLDLNSDEHVANYRNLALDTVVCANVLEHVADDVGALRRLRHLLIPGGRLLLVVPQYPKLFCRYDRELGHYRRYTRESLSRVVEEAGFRVVHIEPFNFPAIFGWWFHGCVLRRARIGRFSMKLFDLGVPIFRRLERWLPLPGISLICIAEAAQSSPTGSAMSTGD